MAAAIADPPHLAADLKALRLSTVARRRPEPEGFDVSAGLMWRAQNPNHWTRFSVRPHRDTPLRILGSFGILSIGEFPLGWLLKQTARLYLLLDEMLWLGLRMRTRSV